jgi:hypothetical protein
METCDNIGILPSEGSPDDGAPVIPLDAVSVVSQRTHQEVHPVSNAARVHSRGARCIGKDKAR